MKSFLEKCILTQNQDHKKTKIYIFTATTATMQIVLVVVCAGNIAEHGTVMISDVHIVRLVGF